MKKVLYLILAVAIIAGGYYAWTQYSQQRTVEALASLQTTRAENGRLVATIGATGTVRSNQTAVLAWQTTGTVEDVSVDPGDTAITEDVLAMLEQTSLPQNIIMAEVELNSALKTLEELHQNAETAKVQALQAIATYAQAVKQAQYQYDNYIPPAEIADLDVMEAVDIMQERLDQAREAFEPYKYLSSGNSTRQDLKEDLDQAQSDYNAAVKRLEYVYQLEVAQANLEKARADFEKWKDGPDPADIENTEARIAAAQATLNMASLAAPFDGEITEVLIKPGDQVSPGTLSFRLDDLSRLLVDVQVSEVDINRITVGQDVSLSFDAILGQTYNGIVVEVASVGSQTLGVVEFKVTVEISAPDENVKPGMTAAVNIVVSELEDVLLVPNRAVRIKDGKRVVYILKDGQPTSVEISLGSSSETHSEVESGDLKQGDEIVLNPPLEFESNGPPPFAR